MLILSAMAAFVSVACAKKPPRASLPPPMKSVKTGWTEDGIASWYGHPYHGRKTANGETYDMNKMTAAHKSLPFGVTVEVHNRTNAKKTRVRINDRGPFIDGRIIDLSRAAAERIDMIGPGTARVRIKVVRQP